MISAYTGGIGNGKTLLMTFHTLLKFAMGYKIISNYGLELDNFIKIEGLEDFLKEFEILMKGFEKGGKKISFAGDEWWKELDSRKSSSKGNIDGTVKFMQVRKVGLDFDWTSQHFGQMDIRIREVTERMYSPRIEIWSGEPFDSDPVLMRIYRYQTDDWGNWKEIPSKEMIITDPLLKLYNTYEVI